VTWAAQKLPNKQGILMVKCQTCGTRFHACSSCGLVDWEWDYCDEECRSNSPFLRDSYLRSLFSFYTKDQLNAAYYFIEKLREEEKEASDLSFEVPGIGANSLLEQELQKQEHNESSYYIHDIQNLIDHLLS
jgi:hypothetical protein